MPPGVRWVYLIWLALLGGCIGSFLNVVVYRLPQRESLVHPPSRCPQCAHAIRWYHNIPVFGWLMLRGRCFDCAAPISMRYPIVEATVAATFFLLAIFGPLATSQSIDQHGNAAVIVATQTPAAWGRYALEVTLCCALLALALIDHDLSAGAKGRFPHVIWMVVAAGGFAVAVIFPIAAIIEDRPLSASLMGGAIGACFALILRITDPAGSWRHAAPLIIMAGILQGPWCLSASIAVTAIVAPVFVAVQWSILFFGAVLATILATHVLDAQIAQVSSSAENAITILMAATVIHVASGLFGERRRARQR